MKEGVTLEQARTEMDGISAQLAAEHPDSNRNVRALITRVQDQLVANIRPPILLLTGAVVLVLLIACANVANLMLARAVDRQKEIAVRIALGARRLRIVRQLIVESIVLSCVGGSPGCWSRSWVISFLTGSAVAGLPRVHNIAIEWRVVVFALALAIATGVIFGLVPAFMRPVSDPRLAERGESGRIERRAATEAALEPVVLEIGLALVLLIGAGLLLAQLRPADKRSTRIQC